MTNGGEREAAQAYLERLIRGTSTPAEVFADARAAWQSGRWPSQGERGFDPIAHDVMFLLADAREMGVTHEDATALLDYLAATGEDAEARWERLYQHVKSVDPTARETLQLSDEYYGSGGAEEQEEMFFSNPEHRRLHRGVRLDPESVWNDVRTLLCEDGDPFDSFKVDLLEDLIFRHADAFMDRIEVLVEECAPARTTVAWIYVGGVDGPGVRRFDALQQRLLREVAPDGVFREGFPADAEER